MSKKNKENNFRGINSLAVFMIPLFLCLFSFFGVKNAKAGPYLPPPPYTWINIGVCTDETAHNTIVDLSNPYSPVIRWYHWGDPQQTYRVIVDSNDTGNIGGSSTTFPVPSGFINLDVADHSYILALAGGRGWTPWASGAFTIPRTDGVCGTGLTFCAGTTITAATPGLCNNISGGLPANFRDNGPWHWDCLGVGTGEDAVNCEARVKPPVSGCATVPPPCNDVDTLSTSGLCKSTSQLMAGPLRTGNVWDWSCRDTACGTTIACDSLEVLPEVVPSCGSDDGKAFCEVGENPENLCNKGDDLGSLRGGAGLYEDWTWTCTGSCPTVSVDCSARGRGACGWKETN